MDLEQGSTQKLEKNKVWFLRILKSGLSEEQLKNRITDHREDRIPMYAKWSFLKWENGQSHMTSLIFLWQHSVLLQIHECIWTVWNTKQFWSLSGYVKSTMALIVLKTLYCLKKMKSWTVTIVMLNVTVVIILGNVVTSRNFVWHCHFVEWVIVNFELQISIKCFSPKLAFSKSGYILMCRKHSSVLDILCNALSE